MTGRKCSHLGPLRPSNHGVDRSQPQNYNSSALPQNSPRQGPICVGISWGAHFQKWEARRSNGDPGYPLTSEGHNSTSIRHQGDFLVPRLVAMAAWLKRMGDWEHTVAPCRCLVSVASEDSSTYLRRPLNAARIRGGARSR